MADGWDWQIRRWRPNHFGWWSCQGSLQTKRNRLNTNTLLLVVRMETSGVNHLGCLDWRKCPWSYFGMTVSVASGMLFIFLNTHTHTITHTHTRTVTQPPSHSLTKIHTHSHSLPQIHTHSLLNTLTRKFFKIPLSFCNTYTLHSLTRT
jgi:hypothetical protein